MTNIIVKGLQAPFKLIELLIKLIVNAVVLLIKGILKLSVVVLYFGAVALPIIMLATGRMQSLEAGVAAVMLTLLAFLISKAINFVFFRKKVTTTSHSRIALTA